MAPLKIFSRLTHGKGVRAEIELIRPYVDREFYLQNNHDVASMNIDPALHYHIHGWKEGRDPSPDFSTRDYLAMHREIADDQTDPLLHYAKMIETKRKATTAIDPATLDEVAFLRPHFNADYYIAQYPDVAKTDIDPVLHYVLYGWHEGRNPSPDFATNEYLRVNKDVSKVGINPFLHYIRFGRDEGRKLFRDDQSGSDTPTVVVAAEVAETSTTESTATAGSIDEIRPYFDSDYYLEQNADVRESGVDPVMHYWASGWREGRNPTPEFSTRYYLESNPDLASQSRPINPFWHYVTAGRAEGRSPQHPGGYRVDQLRFTQPLEKSVKDWLCSAPPSGLLTHDKVRELVLAQGQQEAGELIVSLGHDNYVRVSGGIQFCIQREAQVARERGIAYLNLHPWQALPRLAHGDEDPDPIMVLVLDGAEIGKAHMSEVIAATGELTSRLARIRVVIHQLLGHLPEQVAALVEATGRTDCWMWLHDYFTLCPSINLRRNGVSYCGAPPVESNACTLCRFGPERVLHLARMEKFFDALDVHVIAPSEVALELWQRRSSFRPASATVLPHIRLGRIARETLTDPNPDSAITVAFLGTPAPHKGWHVFELLMAKLKKSPNYRFVFLGSANPPMPQGTRVRVHVTSDKPDAMIDAVAAENCDLVVHWATWPETFSLSTYEAYAGGAMVLTNTISGNVAATVEASKCGAVLETRNDLLSFFEDGRAEELVAKARKLRAETLVRHELSPMIFALWDESASAVEE